MKHRSEWKIGLVDVADGEYMLRQLEGLPTSIARIERMFKLRKNELADYRANNYSRKGYNGDEKGVATASRD